MLRAEPALREGLGASVNGGLDVGLISTSSYSSALWVWHADALQAPGDGLLLLTSCACSSDAYFKRFFKNTLGYQGTQCPLPRVYICSSRGFREN